MSEPSLARDASQRLDMFYHAGASNFCSRAALRAPSGAFVDLPELRIHYRDFGPKEAPVLVLLHGASGNLLDFTCSVFGDLAKTWRVIAFDRPGFGYSPPDNRLRDQKEWWRLEPQIDILSQALHALDAPRYALCGHSYSVGLGLDWARRRPKEVSGLLALSGAMRNWPGATALRYRLGRHPALGRILGAMVPLAATDLFLIEEMAEVFAPQRPPIGYLENAGIRLAARPATFRLNLRAIAELHAETRETMERLDEIHQPVEVLHGDADQMIPLLEDPGPAAAAAPNARFEMLPGVGHMPHHAAPKAVIAAAERLRARLDF